MTMMTTPTTWSRTAWSSMSPWALPLPQQRAPIRAAGATGFSHQDEGQVAAALRWQAVVGTF